MKTKLPINRQLGFFDPDSENVARVRNVSTWPDQERHPLNIGGHSVSSVVRSDLESSEEILIVTGYSSLEYVIDKLGSLHAKEGHKTRLIIGNELDSSQRQFNKISKRTLPQEVADYWLQEGISVIYATEILLIIEKLKSGEIEARYIADRKKKLHAKMIVTDNAVTTGSSNFSYSGMHFQHEFNSRFSKTGDARRYRDARQVAENFWEMGEDYGPDLIGLLEELLKVVSFEEAIGRACSELLEGKWAARYLNQLGEMMDSPLWPSQLKGIGRALWIIENEGSCLIADATGAGKTRMGSHLLKAVSNRMWSKGRVRNDMTVLICPPGNVETSWDEERSKCGLNLVTRSHGILSRSSSDGFKTAANDLRRAQCIAIDEAHNFLNQQSSRTKSLLCNMADHVLLFTATPINKGIRDLINIVDLLGADNLDDESLKLFDALGARLRRQQNHFSITEEERHKLRRLVGRFTLRRTKSDLKDEIQLNPSAYIDAFGNQCSYPKHTPKTYVTSETENDKVQAEKIRKLSGELKGLVNLQSGIEMPLSMKGIMTTDAYVNARLKSAKGLAIYRVMAALRSSRPAVAEHILGTDRACIRFNIKDQIKPEESGNMLRRLEGIRGQTNKSSFKDKLPEWLTDKDAHISAVNQEIAIYKEILMYLEKMTCERDLGKAKLLAKLHKSHKLLIVFDSCLITLSYIKQLLQEQKFSSRIFVATSTRQQERRDVSTAFQLGSNSAGIALCSDALSEGINLQQSSAVVLLDMPSVIRIAEQRIGRVDRLNSPHKEVEIWWPNDSSEFALKTDRKFIQRHTEVAELLGANIEVPDEVFPEELKVDLPSTASEMMGEMASNEKSGKSWDGLQDAFYPVRMLVEGEEAIVPLQVYKQIRDSDARIVSCISVVKASRPWAFFAIAGNNRGAPKWVYLDSLNAMPETRLEYVSAMFREVAKDGFEAIDLNTKRDDVSHYLHSFKEQLERTESQLLPRKKQRALVEMEYVLKKYSDLSQQLPESATADISMIILNALKHSDSESGYDLDSLAECWLDLVREPWFEALMTRRKRIKPLRLKDLRKALVENPIEAHKIETAFSSVAASQPISRRAVVTILGMPEAMN
ncbi:MAG: SNF2-related protein [Mariprofundaceae bacterium]|nr:SNF2-related protein [Mariprofundaceae bacterium]